MTLCKECKRLQSLSKSELERIIESIPRNLRNKDGLKPAFFLLQTALESENSGLREAAYHSLHTILEIIQDKDDALDASVVSSLEPILHLGMLDSAKENYENASWAIAILAKQGYCFDSVWPLILEWLNSDLEAHLSRAVWILRNYSWAGVDISDTISGLESALSSDTWMIRNFAAIALSNELIRSGDEEPLAVRDGITELESLDSDWSVSVFHRRIHAKDDTPFPIPKYTSHFRHTRHCGFCENDAAVCIWYYDDSGTGWIDRTHEYYCDQCGKYTVYHYFD